MWNLLTFLPFINKHNQFTHLTVFFFNSLVSRYTGCLNKNYVKVVCEEYMIYNLCTFSNLFYRILQLVHQNLFYKINTKWLIEINTINSCTSFVSSLAEMMYFLKTILKFLHIIQIQLQIFYCNIIFAIFLIFWIRLSCVSGIFSSFSHFKFLKKKQVSGITNKI